MNINLAWIILCEYRNNIVIFMKTEYYYFKALLNKLLDNKKEDVQKYFLKNGVQWAEEDQL